MLRQRVLIVSDNEYCGKEGIIVAVNTHLRGKRYEGGVVCKVLVGEVITNWLPDNCLKIV
ncbi:MAG: hypothetical protein H5T98_09720 [Syntrophomonadaceae bacterium]|nr:hypothetical protein [Syntrophomonadaceae bacterium]